jgi:CheY-like chemotaxis protein
MGNIFVVEDDAETYRVLERAFRLTGYEVTMASDGQSAWSLLATSEPLPSAVLVDIVMPQMDGLTLVRTIRGNHRFDGVPIMVLTNSFHTEKAEESLQAGADQYVLKIDHPPKDIIKMTEELIKAKTANAKL